MLYQNPQYHISMKANQNPATEGKTEFLLLNYAQFNPHITKPPFAKWRFFVITITKQKRFFMGAFVGALFTRNANKTNNKQCVNREYDSESGTTI